MGTKARKCRARISFYFTFNFSPVSERDVARVDVVDFLFVDKERRGGAKLMIYELSRGCEELPSWGAVRNRRTVRSREESCYSSERLYLSVLSSFASFVEVDRGVCRNKARHKSKQIREKGHGEREHKSRQTGE